MPARACEVMIASWLCLAGPALPALAAPAGRSPRAARPASASRVAAGPADTILARVGPRRVSVAEFRRSWDALRPPDRPDSLTPKSAREFLDLLVDKEALATHAVRERWVWTRQESLVYDAHRDQLTLRAALARRVDAARDSLRRAGLPADDNAAGVAARDHFVAGLRPAFDDSLLARLVTAFQAVPRPSADSGLFAQLRMLGAVPLVRPADTLKAVATTTRGPYSTGAFLRWWAHLSPVLRPRIESPAAMRDMVGNALFETELRDEAERARLIERPDIAATLAREREGMAVDHYIRREVYDPMPYDSTTLRRFYESDPQRWALPQRVRLVRLALPSRTEAERMGARLRDRAEVETLIGEKLPDGPVPNLATPPVTRFVYDVIERDEPRTFRDAIRSGSGAVLGPDSTARGWEVARVVQVIPARRRTFEEAREFVAHDWDAVEGERRMRALIARSRAALKVEINDRALRRMLGS